MLSICVRCGTIAKPHGGVVHKGQPRGVCIEDRHRWEFFLAEDARLSATAWLEIQKYAREQSRKAKR
uniref:Uncharacterized protein n=1 Tax=viral metagenome TaxID=1070528 RepID=A0A6M3L649_9ZZZZ